MSRLGAVHDPHFLPALAPAHVLSRPAEGLGTEQPPPSILLYGSLRERSFSRLATEEAARLLQLFGCETRIFDPADLPCRTRWPATTIRLFMNCVSMRCGRRAWCGAVQSATARSPRS